MLALVAALIHGVLAETKIFPRIRIEPERLRSLIRLVWQCSTVAWMALAVLLIATPSFGSDAGASVGHRRERRDVRLRRDRQCLGNVWPHFGWVALTLVVGLAATGLSP